MKKTKASKCILPSGALSTAALVEVFVYLMCHFCGFIMIHYDSKEITPPLSSGCPRYSYGMTGNREGFKICLCSLSLSSEKTKTV